MRKTVSLLVTMIAVCAATAIAQDDSENLIRKALIGRHVLVKMDLPAINSGIDFVLDNTDVSYNTAKCDKLLKDYGVAVKTGTRSRITDVRLSNRGIELDLDGGGMPTNDWVVGSLKLVEPEPLAKSNREVELERQVSTETSSGHATQLRADLDYERQKRLAQDERNREAFRRAETLRRQYIDENRMNWGSKVVVVIRSRKESVKMRDMVKALAKYVELLPSEKPAE